MYLSGIKAVVIGQIKEISTAVVDNKSVSNVIVTFTEGYNDKRILKNIECSFWNNDAESIKKYPLGHPVMIEGLLKTEGYVNDKNIASVKLKMSVTGWQSLKKIENKQSSQQTEKAESKPQQSIPARKQITEEDEFLKNSLNAVLTFGQYKTMRIKEVLDKDYAYVYRMATECTNETWRKVFLVAYNYFYKQHQKKENATINGNSNVRALSNAHYNAENVPDEDLPF